MKEPTWSARIWSAPFFWRVFILNGLVFVAGVGGLALSPAMFAWPLQPLELLVLVGGLLVMIATNAVLLRMGLAPLERLASMMGTIDLLRPGQRLPERRAGDLTPLVRAFNEMLDRLEAERAASTAAALHAQEDERRRISRELHDEVGQGLTALMLEMSQLNDRAPRSLRPKLSHLLEEARRSLSDVRRIGETPVLVEVEQPLGVGVLDVSEHSDRRLGSRVGLRHELIERLGRPNPPVPAEQRLDLLERDLAETQVDQGVSDAGQGSTPRVRGREVGGTGRRCL